MSPSEHLYMKVTRLTPESFWCFQEHAEILGKIFVEAFSGPVSLERCDTFPEKYHDPGNQQTMSAIQQQLRSEWLTMVQKVCAGVTTLDSQGIGSVPVREIYVITMHKSDGTIIGFAIFYDVASRVLIQEEVDHGSITVFQQNSLVLPYHNGNEVYLDPVAVLPSYQGHGIGKQLLFSIKERCPWVGHLYLATSASKTNTKVQGFYERHGFVPWIRYTDTAGLQSIVYSLCMQQPLHMHDSEHWRGNDIPTNGGMRQ